MQQPSSIKKTRPDQELDGSIKVSNNMPAKASPSNDFVPEPPVFSLEHLSDIENITATSAASNSVNGDIERENGGHGQKRQYKSNPLHRREHMTNRQRDLSSLPVKMR